MPNYNVYSDGYLKTQIYSSTFDIQNFPFDAYKNFKTIQLFPCCGWSFIYNINTELVNTNTTGNGTVSQANSSAVLQTGTATNSTASIQTQKNAVHITGMGILALFSAIFTQGVSGSTQIIGMGDTNDGLFFGYNGNTFGILHRNNGTDTWIAQSSWNVDKLDGKGLSNMNLDTTTGNIYAVEFQWMGYGVMNFFVINPDNGSFTLVHRIHYGNANTLPSLSTPSLPLYAIVENSTNDSNITLETVSAAIHLEGDMALSTSLNHSINSPEIDVNANTETNVLTIRNKSTLSGKNNHVSAKLLLISSSCDGTKITQIHLLRNATLSGTSYQDVAGTNSIMEYDTQGSYTAGSGINIMAYQLGKSDSNTIDTFNYEILLPPGSTLTVTALSTSDTLARASLMWREFY